MPITPPTAPKNQQEVLTWTQRFTDWAFREFRKNERTAQDSVLLVSPGKLVYAVRVADDGTLLTELVKD